ncbi:hypothetical protein PROCH_0947 [Prochlorococcus marinus str. EQPAC1]|nr:hypothetical protein PROCH_0947 [Prochlorococcus marinus str. EQPAC1]
MGEKRCRNLITCSRKLNLKKYVHQSMEMQERNMSSYWKRI